MIQIKTRTIVISVLIALAVCFIGGWLLGRFARNNVATQIINGQNDIIRTYSYEIGGLQKQAYEKDALIMSQKQAIQAGLILKEELRLLKITHATEVTHFESTINILLDSIKHNGSIVITPCPPDENHPVLYLPLIFREQNDYLNLKGEFDENGKLSMEIKIPLNVDVITGYDRKAKVYKTVVGSDNPYLGVIAIQSVKLDLRKPRRWGVGPFAGYGMGWGTTKLVPVFGVGLSYSIIQF
jgi:hypothetical protein